MQIYQESKQKELEEQSKLMDYSAWLNGVYVAKAIGSCFSNKVKYPVNPITLQQHPDADLSETEKFKLWIAEFNSRFDEKKGKV